MFRIKPLTGDHKYLNEYFNPEKNSGIDLYAPTTVTIPARAISFKIPLGIAVEYKSPNPLKPTGYYLYPRSSMGAKTPLRLSNSVGIIDVTYRGEITAIVDNISDEPFTINQGERYFQLCLSDLSPPCYTLTTSLSTTSRGEGGLGSTGK